MKLKPNDFTKFDTTTYKTLVGQRLLIATAIVTGGVLLWEVAIGDTAMVKFILEAWLYFLAIGVLGVNVAQYGAQRFSSKEYKEASERGKIAGVAELEAVREVTKERAAMVINAEDQASVKVEPQAGNRRPSGPTVAVPGQEERRRKRSSGHREVYPHEEHSPRSIVAEPDLYTDDERGE